MLDEHESFLDSNESQEILLIEITMNYLFRTVTESLDVIIILHVLFGTKALSFDVFHVYFQFQITILAEFYYMIAVLVAATPVAALLSEVEVMIQPFLKQFIENYAVHGDYSEEILDLIDLLIEYGDLLGVFIWNMDDKIINLQDVDLAIDGSRIINIASQYINTGAKFEVSLNNFMGKDMINDTATILTQHMNQNNGEFASEPAPCAAFEPLFASHKYTKDKAHLDKHIDALVLRFVDLMKDKKIISDKQKMI